VTLSEPRRGSQSRRAAIGGGLSDAADQPLVYCAVPWEPGCAGRCGMIAQGLRAGEDPHLGVGEGLVEPERYLAQIA